jgi:DnaJ-class molecular chaperone
MADGEVGELISEIATLYDGLEVMSYYDYLAVSRRCDYLAVRDAFYARAQRFHPDRFVNTAGESVKHAVYAVYKRMTEAYNVLSDPELRRSYDEALTRGEARLSAEVRDRRLDAEESKVTNAFARIYLRSGRAKLERGELNAALIDLELGLSLEDVEPLRNLRDEVVRRAASLEDPATGASH